MNGIHIQAAHSDEGTAIDGQGETMRVNRMRQVILAAVSIVAVSGTAQAQGLFDKAKDVAKKSSIGQKATKLQTEAQMIDATGVDLEAKNIPPISVGTLQLGISGADIKNNTGVRLKLYLFNPAQQDAAVPVPTRM